MGPEKEPIDFLKLFLSAAFIQFLVTATDRYAQLQKVLHPNENKMKWSCPTTLEMSAFLGLCFMMGIDRKPSTKMYWSTDPFLLPPLFPQTMSRDRFLQIMRYLHFSNSEQEPLPGHENFDPLFKVKPLVNHFNSHFQQEFTPRRNITIDETMIPFKGRLQFRQYMPKKPHKWAVKVWVLTESTTSYVQYIDIYPGRNGNPQENLGSNVVKRCLRNSNLTNRSYHVYTDNFFTSPELFSDLYENFGTSACGTVRYNRRGLPRDIMCKKPVGVNERGDMKFRQKGCLVASVWKDKKNVYMLSTIHDNGTSEVQRVVNQDGNFSREPFPCPKSVKDYSTYMGGVDTADQYIQYYCFKHKTNKWSKRVFFMLIEIAKFNAFKLFQLSTNSSMTFLDFSVMISKGLVNGFTSTTKKGRPTLTPVENRLTQRHMPTTYEKKSKCHLCNRRHMNDEAIPMRQTKFGCAECGKHLCLPECFTKFHTKRDCYN